MFDKAPVPRSRLRKIGWTKLQLIGKHVTASNLDDLLELAEARAPRSSNARCGEEGLGSALCRHVLQPETVRRIQRGFAHERG